MATKITPTGSPVAVVAGRTTTRTASPAGKSARTTSAPRTEETSTAAIRLHARLQELAELVMNASEVDAGRVADLKQAVRRGVYRLDPQLIAERLIALEFRLNENRSA